MEMEWRRLVWERGRQTEPGEIEPRAVLQAPAMGVRAHRSFAQWDGTSEATDSFSPSVAMESWRMRIAGAKRGLGHHMAQLSHFPDRETETQRGLSTLPKSQQMLTVAR